MCIRDRYYSFIKLSIYYNSSFVNLEKSLISMSLLSEGTVGTGFQKSNIPYDLCFSGQIYFKNSPGLFSISLPGGVSSRSFPSFLSIRSSS